MQLKYIAQHSHYRSTANEVAWVLLAFSLFIVSCLVPQVSSAQTKQHSIQSENSTIVLFPGSTEHNWRSEYTIQLLQQALHRSNKSYVVRANGVQVPKGRNFQMLEQGKDVDVLWSTATNERVQRYSAIPIPILKGMQGMRIALLPANSIRFEKVNRLQDLQGLVAGQMHVWTDAKILSHNGVNLDTSTSYERLFDMLANNRFDYFPRSVTEIMREYEKYRHLGIAIEPDVMLYYPTAMVFYVNKNNHVLHKDIRRGLESMIRDGSFEQLFQQHHAKTLKDLNVANRKIIRLVNPYLPSSVDQNRKELWLMSLNTAAL